MPASPSPPPPPPWLLLQLADAAFPSGGFAHSAGVEAASVIGAVTDPAWLLEGTLWQVGRAALPFVGAAARAPRETAALDLHLDATLSSHVANRASRALGRSLASAAARTFPEHTEVRAVCAAGREGPCHQATLFGALFGALGLEAREAQIAFLHGAARQVLSSAIRLGLLGPLEAQAIQAAHAPLMTRILERAEGLAPDEAAQTAPMLELWGALHDRLDARMFQS